MMEDLSEIIEETFLSERLFTDALGFIVVLPENKPEVWRMLLRKKKNDAWKWKKIEEASPREVGLAFIYLAMLQLLFTNSQQRWA